MKYAIKDISLAKKGKQRIEWAAKEMPVLAQLQQRLRKTKPLKGIKIGACLHVTTETANLVKTLKMAGAQVFLCASNPLSTQDDVAACLVKHYGIAVFAQKGENAKQYYHYLNDVIASSPDLVIDDGADLISTLHRKGIKVMGATEETTTGVKRLKALESKGKLLFPVIAVNNAFTKYLFDNRYGTGQSTIDGILRATNILLAGQKVVIAGYGWCGRGIAMRARGMGAHVIITEVDPLRALEALMDGYQVMTMLEAARIGDLFITTTGNAHVIDKKHLKIMKDGAILANAGHFNVEINLSALQELSKSRKRIRACVDQFLLKDGRKIYLLGEGRLVNLVSAEGHPAEVMDMSFSNQMLSLIYLKENYNNLTNKVYKVPVEIDSEIARLKLAAFGVKIDKLSSYQKRYQSSWQQGTG